MVEERIVCENLVEGRIKFYNSFTHYGFIFYGDQEIFFHENSCLTIVGLTAGSPVCFRLAKDSRGRSCAVNVKLLRGSGLKKAKGINPNEIVGRD